MKVVQITQKDLRLLAQKIREASQMAEGQDKVIKFLTLSTWCDGVANMMDYRESGVDNPIKEMLYKERTENVL